MSKLPKILLPLIVILILVAGGWWVYDNYVNNKSTDQANKEFQPSGTDNSKVSTRDPNLPPDKTDQFRVEYGRIKDILPYEQNGVRVTYDEKLGFIIARIKDVKTKEEFLSKKLTVETLLKSKGVQDLCGLGITWYGPDDLKLELKDQLSAGCTV